MQPYTTGRQASGGSVSGQCGLAMVRTAQNVKRFSAVVARGWWGVGHVRGRHHHGIMAAHRHAPYALRRARLPTAPPPWPPPPRFLAARDEPAAPLPRARPLPPRPPLPPLPPAAAVDHLLALRHVTGAGGLLGERLLRCLTRPLQDHVHGDGGDEGGVVWDAGREHTTTTSSAPSALTPADAAQSEACNAGGGGAAGAATAVLGGADRAFEPRCGPLRIDSAKVICRDSPILMLVLMVLFWPSAGAGVDPHRPRP